MTKTEIRSRAEDLRKGIEAAGHSGMALAAIERIAQLAPLSPEETSVVIRPRKRLLIASDPGRRVIYSFTHRSPYRRCRFGLLLFTAAVESLADDRVAPAYCTHTGELAALARYSGQEAELVEMFARELSALRGEGEARVAALVEAELAKAEVLLGLCEPPASGKAAAVQGSDWVATWPLQVSFMELFLRGETISGIARGMGMLRSEESADPDTWRVMRTVGLARERGRAASGSPWKRAMAQRYERICPIVAALRDEFGLDPYELGL